MPAFELQATVGGASTGIGATTAARRVVSAGAADGISSPPPPHPVNTIKQLKNMILFKLFPLKRLILLNNN